MDAASRDSMQKATGAGKANPEKIGLADQVGSASGSSGLGKETQGSSKNGSEEGTLPRFFNALKKTFGFKTSPKKRDTVVEKPTEPPDSTRFVGRKETTGKIPASDKESGPEALGNPDKKDLPGEQHEHLTQKEGASGNVGDESVLPSQRKGRTSEGSDEPRRFRSGARG